MRFYARFPRPELSTAKILHFYTMNTLILLALFAFSPLHPFTFAPLPFTLAPLPFTLAPCILGFAEKGTLDTVLTPDLLADVLPNRTPPTKKYVTKYVPVGYQLCQYSWKGARETSLTVNGQTTVVTKPDIVALGNVRPVTPSEKRPKFPAVDLPADLQNITAVWDSTNSELIIYEETVQYSIRVDIDNDVKKNQKVAVELAGKLKCE